MSSGSNQSAVLQAVVWNSLFWTAGYSLTSGGYLTYFTHELGASPTALAFLQAMPESAGLLALLAPAVIRRFGSVKWSWAWLYLAARAVTLGIPWLGLWSAPLPVSRTVAVWTVIAGVGVAQALHAVSFVAFLSWLTQLSPSTSWGRLFAARNIATLLIQLGLPTLGGYLKGVVVRQWPTNGAAWFYVGAFGLGTLLMLIAMLPLLRLPDQPLSTIVDVSRPSWRDLLMTWNDRRFRRLLIFNWWFAWWNGMTQAVFYQYRLGPLKIDLQTHYLLEGAMRLTQIPVAAWSGLQCDRGRPKQVMGWGVAASSTALLFWMWASPESPNVLWGAYVLWGGFAAVNVAGPNLVRKLTPEDRTAAAFALFSNVAGWLAGMSGILGGLCLEHLLRASPVLWGGWVVSPYLMLFFISWVGRASALAWLARVPVPEIAPRIVRDR